MTERARFARIAARIALAALVVVLGVSRGATAADAPPPAAAPSSAAAPSPAVKSEARERFDTGLHLFEKGENAGALAEFKRAYQLIPNPSVLYNMGLVYAAMNRPVDAVDTLNQFLGEPGEAGSEQKTHAEQVRTEQTKRIAQLVVLTDHPATIEVDGIEVGRTPLAKPIRVASGSHVVAVEAPGFLGSRREVTLAGQLTETIAMGMEPTDARMAQLVVTAALPGAEVVVNGKRIGATPLPASVSVPPGKVTVEVQRAGYLTASQAISLDEGARGELTFTLEQDPAAAPSLKGRLVVTASEPGTDMTIDGGARQPIVSSLSLPVGPHHVRVEKNGFEVAERNVEVVNGQDASLLVTLVPTTETEAQRDSSRSTIRNAGWTIVIAGAALLAGGVIYGAVSQRNATSSQSSLNDLLATNMKEYLPGMAMVKNPCWQDPTDPGAMGEFVLKGCAANVTSAQNSVSTAKLERDLGFGAAALGLVAVGVGVAVVATHGAAEPGAGVQTANVWSDGHGSGGLMLGGRF